MRNRSVSARSNRSASSAGYRESEESSEDTESDEKLDDEFDDDDDDEDIVE